MNPGAAEVTVIKVSLLVSLCIPFRSRFLAPMVVCVVTLVSILTV